MVSFTHLFWWCGEELFGNLGLGNCRPTGRFIIKPSEIIVSHLSFIKVNNLE